jgi:hypothetical protein
MVDRIVLLGAPDEGVSVADTGPPRPSQEAPALVSSAVPMSPGAGESATTGERQASVGDMLQSQAVAGLPHQPTAVPEPAALSATGR